MTGEDLGYRPDPVQKATFEYSPLGQVFNKGLDFNAHQEGLLKRLKKIEGQNEQQSDLIKNQGDRQLDLIGKTSLSRTKSIGFQNEGLINLEKQLRNKEKDSRNKSKSKDEEEKKLFFLIQQQITHHLNLVMIYGL